jgi:glycosyltransferase involved in cell wall biosynthesis
MIRVAHVLFGGLGGHGSVVFSLIAGSRGDAEHVLAFVSRGELLEAHRRECESRDIPNVHVEAGATAGLESHVRVMAWLRRQRPDAILVHSGGYLPAALLARIGSHGRSDVILVEHQSWPLRTRRHKLTTLIALLTRSPIVVLTEAYASSLRAAHPRLSRRSLITVIPNGIDLDRFSPCPKEPASDRPAIIGMQSRMVPIKDHPTLLSATAKLLENGAAVRLLLAGDGPSRPLLESFVRELGIGAAVSFVGVLGEAEVAEFLKGLDVYVHASLGEAMSTALLQAFATGVPVIASDVAGIREMVDGADVAVLVPPQDPDALVGAIARLLSDPGERSALASRGRSFVTARYSNVRMWRAYEGLICGGPP